jgi:hypothetical protein
LCRQALELDPQLIRDPLLDQLHLCHLAHLLREY